MSDEKIEKAREELLQQKIQQQQAQATVNNIAASIFMRCADPYATFESNETLATKSLDTAYAFASKALGIRRRGPADVTPVKGADVLPMAPAAKAKKPRKTTN